MTPQPEASRCGTEAEPPLFGSGRAQLLAESSVWKCGQPAASSTCPCWIPAIFICWPGQPGGVGNRPPLPPLPLSLHFPSLVSAPRGPT